ncbi:hypothetical protein [Mangrovicoccus ximenensis]|uniref:hypothetical protein n=1 Tax=Mangrovicoccus ximenensis TaxID=1911570 RepID=UPI000D35E801|nr:hypothetical protein [Mangrovicoccus ximenensis]
MAPVALVFDREDLREIPPERGALAEALQLAEHRVAALEMPQGRAAARDVFGIGGGPQAHAVLLDRKGVADAKFGRPTVSGGPEGKEALELAAIVGRVPAQGPPESRAAALKEPP